MLHGKTGWSIAHDAIWGDPGQWVLVKHPAVEAEIRFPALLAIEVGLFLAVTDNAVARQDKADAQHPAFDLVAVRNGQIGFHPGGPWGDGNGNAVNRGARRRYIEVTRHRAHQRFRMGWRSQANQHGPY